MPENSLKTILLGVPISRFSLSEALSECSARIQNRKGGTACFVNVHTLTESQSKPELRRALNEATFSFADGLPLVWFSRLKKRGIRGRVCGPDFMEAFLKTHPSLPQGFIGGNAGVAQKLMEKFGVQGIAFSPTYRPFSASNAKEDWETFLSLWRKTYGEKNTPSAVWIGLGAPKQEQWVETIRQIAPETFFFAVGAAFDFHSGSVKRAPKFFQKIGLEWFYRLSQEPSRLAGRYLKYNSQFLRLSLKELLTESHS